MGVTVIGGSSAGASTATLGSYTKTPISSARTELSYSNISFSSASTNIMSGMYSFAFSYDGNYLVLASNTDDIYFHSLSTPWDVSTATNTATDYNLTGLNNNRYIQTQGGSSQGGTEAGIYVNSFNTEEIIFYPFISSYSSLNDANRVAFDYSSITPTQPVMGFEFFDNGTKLLLVTPVASNSTAWVVPLSTAWDLSTANAAAATSYSLPSTRVNAISFEETGLWAIVSRIDVDTIELWSMTTAYDVSTATVEDTYTNSTYGENITVAWNRDTHDKFYGYNVQDGDDITTFTLTRLSSDKPDSYQVCTLDLSSGNTFVVDDIYDYQSTLIQTENNPDSGTLKSYKVMLPYASSASSSASLVNISYIDNLRRSFIDNINDASIRMFFADNGKKFLISSYTQSPTPLKMYNLKDPYDITGYFMANPVPASTSWSANSVTGSTHSLHYLSDDGTFSISRNHTDNTIDKLSYASPFASKAIATESFTPTGPAGIGEPFVSQDGKYLYIFTTTTADNYIMSRPFDLTSATLHTSAPTDIWTRSPGDTQVTQKGDVLMFALSSPNAGGGFYTSTMSTPHNLTTLSAPTMVYEDRYMRHMYLYDDDKKFLTYDYQSSGLYSVRSSAVDINFPDIVLSPSMYPEQSLDLKLRQDRTVEFTLSTTDGGSTFIAHKGA